MEADSDEPVVPKRKKRTALLSSDDEEETRPISPRKKPTTGPKRKNALLSSDDEDAPNVSPPKKKVAITPKTNGAASISMPKAQPVLEVKAASRRAPVKKRKDEDFFALPESEDESISDYMDEDDEKPARGKAKVKPAAKKTTPAKPKMTPAKIPVKAEPKEADKSVKTEGKTGDVPKAKFKFVHTVSLYR